MKEGDILIMGDLIVWFGKLFFVVDIAWHNIDIDDYMVEVVSHSGRKFVPFMYTQICARIRPNDRVFR